MEKKRLTHFGVHTAGLTLYLLLFFPEKMEGKVGEKMRESGVWSKLLAWENWWVRSITVENWKFLWVIRERERERELKERTSLREREWGLGWLCLLEGHRESWFWKQCFTGYVRYVLNLDFLFLFFFIGLIITNFIILIR